MPVGIGLTIGVVDGRLTFSLTPRFLPRGRGDVLPPRLFARLNPAEKIPFPDDDPTPRRTRQPFPRGPAANDPVFDIWRKRLAKILARGNVAIGSAEFMAILLDTFGQQKVDVALDEFKRRRSRTREARNRMETEVRTIGDEVPATAEPAEDFPTFPRPEAPGQPGRITLPGDVPGTIIVPPGAPGLPNFPQLPSIPAPQRLPDVPSIPDTGPGFWPGAPDLAPNPGFRFDPFRQPGVRTRPGSKPKSQPARSPQLQPTGDPLRLTRVEPRVLQSPGLQAALNPGLNLNPRNCPKPRCKKKRRTLRGKCYKGLYKEGRWSDEVDFTRWVEISCSTGRELGRSNKLRGI